MGNLSTPRRTNAGAIAGGVVGGLLGLLILLGLLLWFRRRQRRLKVAPSSEFLTGGSSPAALFSAARARALEGLDEDLEKSPPPFQRETWASSIAEKVLAAEEQRGRWGTPDYGPELQHHGYGLQHSVEEPDDLQAISPSTERSARSERSFLAL